MARLKALHAIIWLLFGTLAIVSHAAPPIVSLSKSSANSLHNHTSHHPHDSGKHTKTRSKTHSKSHSKKPHHNSSSPSSSSSSSIGDNVVTVTAPTTPSSIVTVTPSTPPRPTVTSIFFTTSTPPIPLQTTTITTLIPPPVNLIVVSPEEHNARMGSISAGAATKKAGSPASQHQQDARQDDPVTIWPSTSGTIISAQSTCTESGLMVACTPGSFSNGPSMPQFDDGSASCYSTSISGLSLDHIRSLLAAVCPPFQDIVDSDSSPRIVTVDADADMHATFQLDYNFTGTRAGSSVIMGQDAGIEDFTRALMQCNDNDGYLYQNGLISATMSKIPMTFLFSVVEVGSKKRADHNEQGCLPKSFAKDEAQAIKAAKDWCINTAVWTYTNGTSPWPEVLSETDGDYLAVNITNTGSGNMTVTKTDCEEVFSQKLPACAVDDQNERFKWSYTIGQAEYSIEYVPSRGSKGDRNGRHSRDDGSSSPVSESDSIMLALEDSESMSSEFNTLSERQALLPTVPMALSSYDLWNISGSCSDNSDAV